MRATDFISQNWRKKMAEQGEPAAQDTGVRVGSNVNIDPETREKAIKWAQAGGQTPAAEPITQQPVTQPDSAAPVPYQGSQGSQQLQKMNPDIIKDVNKIRAGDTIQTPQGSYTIKPGDTLDKIARQTVQPTRPQAPSTATTPAPSGTITVPSVDAMGAPTGQQEEIPVRPAPVPSKPTPAPVPSKTELVPGKTDTSQGMASSGKNSAADVNNPTGLGWNPKTRTWTAFSTPEEGVAATQRQLSRYLSSQGPMRKIAPTPENVVSMWVTGGSVPANKIQNGAYVQSVRNELANAGVTLGPNGEIPNTPLATLAITRAMVKHETAPRHQQKFQAALYPDRQGPVQVATAQKPRS